MLSQPRFILAVLIALIVFSTRPLAQPQPTSSQAGQLTVMTVTVTDRRGNYVMGLTRDAFVLTDERVVRPISLFARVDEPISIGIIVDTSASMQQPDVREVARPKPIADAIWRFLELANGDNEYFLASFDVTFRVLADWRNAQALKADKPAIAQEKQGTALYDACLAALDKLSAGRHQKRALILFSDGIDGVSKRKYAELVRILRESDVILYAIVPRQIFGTPFGPIKILFRQGEEVLAELALLTGGVAFAPENKKDFERAIEQVAIELRHQYRLGFRVAQTPSPNKWRRLKVKVTPPANSSAIFSKLTIRSRQSYYPH